MILNGTLLVQIFYLAISGDMRAVMAEALRREAPPPPPSGSDLTRATVGVMGRDRTGTDRVSATTVRVSALTWEYEVV